MMKNRPRQRRECYTAMTYSPQILHFLAAAAASSWMQSADCILGHERSGEIDASVVMRRMKSVAAVACAYRCEVACQDAT